MVIRSFVRSFVCLIVNKTLQVDIWFPVVEADCLTVLMVTLFVVVVSRPTSQVHAKPGHRLRLWVSNRCFCTLVSEPLQLPQPYHVQRKVRDATGAASPRFLTPHDVCAVLCWSSLLKVRLRVVGSVLCHELNRARRDFRRKLQKRRFGCVQKM